MKKIAFVVTESQRGLRLDQVLAEGLVQELKRDVSRAKARKLIVAGAVYLNGRRVRIASKPLLPRARIEAHVDERKLFESDATSADRLFVMTTQDVLFEDESLIVVNKPFGLPTQPTLDDARANLFQTVKSYLGPDAYVGLHHRLDRDTSGVILFTKRKEANAGVAELFAQRKIEKIYWALSFRDGGREPPAEWSVRNYLGKATGRRNAYQSVRAGGDPAHTDFRRLELFPALALIEARPRTGRTHQIRVHLSEDGYPILGDTTYGGVGAGIPSAPRLLLHAASLTFPHPISKTEISVQSPIPEDFLKCLPRRPEAAPTKGSPE